MNAKIAAQNARLADELTDGYFESYGTLYRVHGGNSIVAWGATSEINNYSCIMTMDTDTLRKSIRESVVDREMNPVTKECYELKLNEIISKLL